MSKIEDLKSRLVMIRFELLNQRQVMVGTAILLDLNEFPEQAMKEIDTIEKIVENLEQSEFHRLIPAAGLN